MDKLYELTQTKYKDRSLTILGNDIMQSLTNKNHNNNPEVLAYFQKLIDQAADDKKRQAQKKKEEIMR
jgi:replicative DNA helicase